MTRVLASLALALSLTFMPSVLFAQDAASKSTQAPALKVGKDEKVCRQRFADGEIKAWVCKKDAACCSWDEAKYVRCGTITGCLIGTAPISERSERAPRK
jgi:hypothetical protein